MNEEKYAIHSFTSKFLGVRYVPHIIQIVYKLSANNSFH